MDNVRNRPAVSTKQCGRDDDPRDRDAPPVVLGGWLVGIGVVLLGILIALVGTVVQWLVAVAVGAYRAYALGFADAVGKQSA